MKKILSLLLIHFASLSAAQTYYKASTFSCAEHFIVPAPDGGGYFDATHRIIGGLSRATLIKMDSSAVIQWLMEFMGPEIVATSAVTPTRDSGFVIATQLRYTGGNYQLYIIKTDNGLPGDTLWTRLYTELGSDVNTTSVKECPDGGLAFFGKKTNPNRLFMMKTDSGGNLVFEKNFSDTSGFNKCEGVVTSDGGFALTGGRWALLKTDSLGILQWYSPYRFNAVYDIKRHILETPDHKLLLFGQDTVLSTTYDYVWLKYDLTGNLIDRRVLNGVSKLAPTCISLLKDKGYILSGDKDTTTGHFIPALVRLDSMMNVSWANGYMPDFSILQYGRFQTAFGLTDGRIVAAGYDQYPPHSLPCNLIMKANPDGSSCNAFPIYAESGPTFNLHNHTYVPVDLPGALQPVMPTSIFIATHSPTYVDVCSTMGISSTEFHAPPVGLIESGNAWKLFLEGDDDHAELNIFDLAGKEVLHTAATDGALISHENLAKGCYFYRINHRGGVASGKVMVSNNP